MQNGKRRAANQGAMRLTLPSPGDNHSINQFPEDFRPFSFFNRHIQHLVSGALNLSNELGNLKRPVASFGIVNKRNSHVLEP
jgi:hypothetical protein